MLVQGRAELVEDSDEQQAAEAMLRAKYGQYEKLLEKGCAIIRVTLNSVISWRQIS